ncbi:uncharacterized protein LOC135499731 [Lineus longissimus]|uniref:uncharacterized protein LOC135499731 n=1 Tax=Lineus longissimus TaxID=88925 RepID=UPI002B4D6A65
MELIESEKTKAKGAKKDTKEKEEDLANAGLVIRKRAMQTLVANEDQIGKPTAATPKKSKKGVAHEYAHMKMIELEVRREELAFKKHEMEMMKEERRERMELERKEKEGLVNLLQGLLQVIKEK